METNNKLDEIFNATIRRADALVKKCEEDGYVSSADLHTAFGISHPVTSIRFLGILGYAAEWCEEEGLRRKGRAQLRFYTVTKVNDTPEVSKVQVPLRNGISGALRELLGREVTGGRAISGEFFSKVITPVINDVSLIDGLAQAPYKTGFMLNYVTVNIKVFVAFMRMSARLGITPQNFLDLAIRAYVRDARPSVPESLWLPCDAPKVEMSDEW